MSDPVDYFIAFAQKVGILAAPYLDPVENALIRSAYLHFPAQAATVADFLKSVQSPLSQRLPLMNAFHVLVIVLAYFFMVYFGKIIMSTQKKFQAKTFSLMHNTFLTTLSAYMFYSILAESVKQAYSLFGNQMDQTENGWPVRPFSY